MTLFHVRWEHGVRGSVLEVCIDPDACCTEYHLVMLSPENVTRLAALLAEPVQ